MLAAIALLVHAQSAVDFVERCPAPLLPTAAFVDPKGRPIAPSTMEVVSTSKDQTTLKSCSYENHLVREVTLTLERATGSTFERGQVLPPGTVLGEAGKLLIEGRPPRLFFREHPHLWSPRTEPVLVVVDVEGHQARHYRRGERTHSWDVGRGQAAGEKEQRGDLKTPRGLYFVTDKTTGPFSGDFAGYYGGHWIKVNYPNAFDAQRGLAMKALSTEQAEGISRAWWQRQLTIQKTKLGGGIGFHGWIAPWSGDVEGYGLSWGCVVFHPEDVAGFYAQVPVGAAVVFE